MNALPSFSRACTRCSAPLRQNGCKTPAFKLSKQTYFSTSIAKSNAQPIDLSSGTTPVSSAEESTLAHDILSRAEIDPSSPNKTTSSATPPPTRQPQSQQRQKKHHHTTQAENSVFVGRVSRTSTMLATVQITRHRQIYDKFLQKHYTRPLRLLAHDPNPPNFLREGDVVEYSKWTEAEMLAKQEKKQSMLDRQLVRAEEKDASNEEWQRIVETQKAQQGTATNTGRTSLVLGHGPAVRELLAKRARAAKEAAKYPTKKKRGVRFVVRRVVSPFGLPIEERMDPANIGQEVPGSASQGGSGTDSLLKGVQGNVSKQHANASVAG